MLHVTASLIYYLFVILCASTHAHPIQRLTSRQDLSPSPLPSPFPSPASLSPGLSTLPAVPPTLIQTPLVQIVAPNVTPFAALDSPQPQPSTPAAPSFTDTPRSVGGVVPNPQSSNDAPLLLPTSSLALAPSQIYHVNESLFYGAGGTEPLTVSPFLFNQYCPSLSLALDQYHSHDPNAPYTIRSSTHNRPLAIAHTINHKRKCIVGNTLHRINKNKQKN